MAALTHRGEPDPEIVAEELLALIIGVAVQASFDPAQWPTERQRAVVDTFRLG